MIEITHTHPNGSVNARLTLTFTAGGEELAKVVGDMVERRLVETAGTAHVPAVDPRKDTR